MNADYVDPFAVEGMEASVAQGSAAGADGRRRISCCCLFQRFGQRQDRGGRGARTGGEAAA